MEILFKNVQKFLKDPPIIIWGSGGTVPYGYPEMSTLNAAIKKEVPDFNQNEKHLEAAINDYLGHECSDTGKIKRIIRENIIKADVKFLSEEVLVIKNKNNPIVKLIDWVKNPHPCVANIITTNYDRAIEYLLSYNAISFTDGFIGRELSQFNVENFKEKNIVNLIKVHGSMNWFKVNDEARYMCECNNNAESCIILPTQKKYKEVLCEDPFRELIHKSDELINEHHSFLVVGFGFNDEHITPKIIKKIKTGVPLVLITKNAHNCENKLKSASNIALIEHGGEQKTEVYVKNNNREELATSIPGEYWQLKNFLEIITSET